MTVPSKSVERLDQRSHVEYVPHSRPKKFYLVLPQLRHAVKPDTYIERFHFPKKRVFWRDKSDSQRDALGLAVVLLGLVGLYLVAYAWGL